MKKKLLFVANQMQLGGIQKSLANLLTLIKDDYNIDLYLFGVKGPLISDIPSEIGVIPAPKKLRYLGTSQTKQTLQEEGLFFFFKRGFYSFLTKVMGREKVVPRIIAKADSLYGYDAAISYFQNPSSKGFFGGTNEFVLEKVNAEKKIAFMHADFKEYGGNNSFNRKQYTLFDTVVAVSNGAKDGLTEVIPELKNKVVTIPNAINIDEINNNAHNETQRYDKNFFNIVTIARLSYEKGILRAIEAIKEIKANGYKVKWHVIGDGNLRKKTEQAIRRLNMGDDIILYGLQKNPYRFLPNADLFLLPSYNESEGMVLKEAMALEIPVLTTRTVAAEEIVDSKYGYVCENSQEGIVRSIKRILDNREELQIKKQNLRTYRIDNEITKKRFEEMIDR